MAYIYAWIETDWDAKVMWREWVKAVKNISNFCEMVKLLWKMFYYNDINSGMYLQT